MRYSSKCNEDLFAFGHDPEEECDMFIIDTSNDKNIDNRCNCGSYPPHLKSKCKYGVNNNDE